MLGRRIGIVCGLGLVACAASVCAQLPSSPNPITPPAAPYDGATVPATYNSVPPATSPANNPPATNPVVPAAAPSREPMLLAPPESRPVTKLPSPKTAAAADAAAKKSSGASGIFTSLAALAVVLALFFALAALLRRGLPNQARTLPPEAVEILGRMVLPGRRQGHLIRVGNKISLVSFSNSGAEPLIEITDPLEVDRLAGLCRQNDPHSATGSFRSIVDQFFREKPPTDGDARTASRRGAKGEVDDE